MVVPPKHPKMVISSGTTILGTPHVLVLGIQYVYIYIYIYEILQNFSGFPGWV